MSNTLNSNQGRVKALGALSDSIARRQAKINEHRKVIAERERLIAVAEKEINARRSTYARIQNELIGALAGPVPAEEPDVIVGVTDTEGKPLEHQIQVISTEGSASPPVLPKARTLEEGDNGYFLQPSDAQHPGRAVTVIQCVTAPTDEGNLVRVIVHERTQHGTRTRRIPQTLGQFGPVYLVPVEESDLPVWMLS